MKRPVSAWSNWPLSTRSSARLRIEKHPSGTGDSSGSHSVQTWVATFSLTSTRPAAPARTPSRPPTFEGRDRSFRMASRTMASMAGSPTSRRKVDQSVSISETGPPGRTTRRELVDGRLGIDNPLQRPLGPRRVEGAVQLIERQGVTDGEPHPTRRRGRPIRAALSLALDASMPTISPAPPRSSAASWRLHRVHTPHRGAAHPRRDAERLAPTRAARALPSTAKSCPSWPEAPPRSDRHRLARSRDRASPQRP